MALLGNGVRAATVKASPDQPATVAALDVQAFNKLINDSRVLHEELNDLIEKRNLVNQLQMISSIDHKSLAAILKNREAIEYESGHNIIRQGEVGETFYLLLDGTVDIIVHDARGEATTINQLGKGSYFGEMALLGDKRRQATVRVSQEGTAKVVELTAAEFEELTRSSEQFKQHVDGAAGARKKQLESGRQEDRK